MRSPKTEAYDIQFKIEIRWLEMTVYYKGSLKCLIFYVFLSKSFSETESMYLIKT